MKTPLFICFFIFSMLFVISCSDDDSPKLRKAEPIVLKSTFDKKLEQDNHFAIDLFKIAYQTENETNIFISPLSVSMALNMTMNGAKNNTLEEMLQVLRVSGYSIDDINEYSKTMREALLKADQTTQIAIANSIWYKEGFDVDQPFINVNKNHYNAEVTSLNFADNNAISRINNWCANHTNNKITKIIDIIPNDMVMYLINAIYFKAIWVNKFEKKNTSETIFYAEDGEEQKIRMMTQENKFNYSTDEICSYLELPYGNEAFSMIAVLPNEGKSIADVVNNMTFESWHEALTKMSQGKVKLFMPLFKFETKYKLHENILPQMGMIDAFDISVADFSGINNNKQLHISDVIHKAYVEVNEEGTEAAAVTSTGVLGDTSPGPGNVLRFDKPFIFVIKEQSTGIILFIGKVGKIIQ